MASYWSTYENEGWKDENYFYRKFLEQQIGTLGESYEDSLAIQTGGMSLEGVHPKRLKNPRVTILNEILEEKAKLNDDMVAENRAILLKFLNSFIPEMKCQDRLFASLFREVCFTGSFYAGLRITTPDEFDLNLVLKMPKSHTVTYHHQVPSYAKYQTTDERSLKENEYGLSKLFENGYLIPNKVRIWMQSVVDKAVRVYRPPSEIAGLNLGAAGPARTVRLVKRNGGVIDIDLVPVIECSLLKPPGIDGRVYERVKDDFQCFLVPKPYQTIKQAPINEAESLRLWRAHYPKADELIIYDLGCVKNIIRLLKLLRDKEDWSILASYYLKTVVMWMILKNPSKDFWNLDKMGERFLEALERLRSCVQEKRIPYFFSTRYNLLEKISEAHAYNIYHRLCAIIKDIEKNDRNLWKIFGCPPTFSL